MPGRSTSKNGASTAARREPTSLHQIVIAAAQMMRERGYASTTLNDIADSVGIQKSSLYHHIGSKQELLKIILDEGLARSMPALEEILEDDSVKPSERLDRAVRMHVIETITSRDITMIFFRGFSDVVDRKNRVDYETKRRHYEVLFGRLIEDCMKETKVKADPKIIRLLMLVMLNGIANWYSPTGPATVSQIADEATHAAARMVGYK